MSVILATQTQLSPTKRRRNYGARADQQQQICLFNLFILYKARNPQGEHRKFLTFILSVVRSLTTLGRAGAEEAGGEEAVADDGAGGEEAVVEQAGVEDAGSNSWRDAGVMNGCPDDEGWDGVITNMLALDGLSGESIKGAACGVEREYKGLCVWTERPVKDGGWGVLPTATSSCAQSATRISRSLEFTSDVPA
ncbi:hypothetical protein INR49_007531 [Caranx melampygus]|nr:hypothetical protein INR49_007531 [Caranx melampygus]